MTKRDKRTNSLKLKMALKKTLGYDKLSRQHDHHPLGYFSNPFFRQKRG